MYAFVEKCKLKRPAHCGNPFLFCDLLKLGITTGINKPLFTSSDFKSPFLIHFNPVCPEMPQLNMENDLNIISLGQIRSQWKPDRCRRINNT